MLIGMVIISMLATVLALTMAEFSDNYDVDYTDNESLAVISKLEKLNESATNYKDILYESEDSSNTVDVLGRLFDTGYSTIKTVAGSFSTLNAMIDSGLGRLNMGAAAPVIRTALLVSLIILIFVGIIISTVVKRET